MIGRGHNDDVRPGVSLLSQEMKENPYPTYAFLRENFPVCKVEPDGIWVAALFDDIRTINNNPTLFSKSICSALYEPDWFPDTCKTKRLIISQDPPEHGKYHSLVNRAFIESAIVHCKPLMQKTADHLLAGFTVGEAKDFTSHFSYPYVGKIIRELLGLGEKQSLAELREWSELEELVTPSKPSDEFIAAFERVIVRQKMVFMGVIEERRQHPQDDFVTGLVNAEVDGEKLSNEYLIGLMCVLVSAGFVTTIQLLNLAMVFLAQNPAQMQLLVDSPERIPDFIEELLRFSPSVLATIRVTTDDASLSGVTIPKGEMVLPLLASANRDALHFDRPEVFNIDRPRRQRHMAFGTGLHFCIGAALSRLELKIALESIVNNFTSFSCPENSQLSWVSSIFVRGVSDLPLTFHRHSAQATDAASNNTKAEKLTEGD